MRQQRDTRDALPGPHNQDVAEETPVEVQQEEEATPSGSSACKDLGLAIATPAGYAKLATRERRRREKENAARAERIKQSPHLAFLFDIAAMPNPDFSPHGPAAVYLAAILRAAGLFDQAGTTTAGPSEDGETRRDRAAAPEPGD